MTSTNEKPKRTSIKLVDGTYVELTAIHPITDEPIKRTFVLSGSRIKDYDNGKNICEGLCNYGNTLCAHDPQDMLEVIRAHWRKLKREQRRVSL